MNGSRPNGHADLGPELRQLAQAVLDRIDPALRTAAARAGEGPGKCQQVWCPVCALAALVTGEEHPLLTVISEHSVALLAVVRAMVSDPDVDRSGTPTPEPPDGPPGGPATPAGPRGEPTPTPTPTEPATGRYQPIPINVEE